MKNRIQKNIAIMIALTMFASLLIPCGFTESYAAAASTSLSAPDDVVVKQSGNHALVLTWKKVKGAKGYEVRKARGNLGGYKKLKTVRKTTYKDRTVGLGRSGTYKVRAYRIQNGKKVYSPYSYPVSAKVCSKTAKRQNAALVDLGLAAEQDKGSTGYLLLNIGESINKDYEEFFVTVEGPKKKGKKERYSPLHSKVRWFSTDPSVVKASSKWGIKAGNKPGRAYIYVRAHNGKRSNKVLVVVKDYAYEPVDIQYAPGPIQVLFKKCEKDIRDICSYYCIHNNMNFGESYYIFFDGEEYVTEGTLSDTTMLPAIKRVLEQSPFQATSVQIWGSEIRLKIDNYPAESYYLRFLFERNSSNRERYELSPYWYYYGEIFV